MARSGPEAAIAPLGATRRRAPVPRYARAVLPSPKPFLGSPRFGMIALTALVAVGSIARLLLHRGVIYSPADEQVYATYSCEIATHGPGVMADQVATYLSSPNAQLFPPPTRWGLLWPDAAAAALGTCGPAAVAWASTLAGIALLIVVAVFTWRRFNPTIALIATALVGSSPLQLHLGRRALGDEIVALVAFAAFWAILAYTERRSRLRWLAVVGVLLIGCATKEVFLTLYPALALPLVLAWIRERRIRLIDVAALAFPALLNVVIVAVLARDPDALVHVIKAVHASAESSYASDYLSGAPHRITIDLLALAPVAGLLALMSIGLLPDRGTYLSRVLSGALALSLLPFAFLGVQLVRLVAVSDVLVAIVAAWGLATVASGWSHRPWLRVGAITGTTAIAVSTNVAIISTLAEAGLYDPVTDTLLRAFGMIP